MKPAQMVDLIEALAGEKASGASHHAGCQGAFPHLTWETSENAGCAEHPEGFDDCCQTLAFGPLDMQIALRKEVAD